MKQAQELRKARLSRAFVVGLLMGFSVIGAALWATASGADRTAPSQDEIAVAADNREQKLAGIIEDQHRLALADGNDSQADVLEDGAVTGAEYRDAMSRAFSCADAAGVKVRDFGPDWHGLTVRYEVEYPSDQIKAAQQTFDDCYAKYAMAVDIAHQMTIDDERTVLETSAKECTAQRVASLPADSINYVEVELACREEALRAK